MGDIRYIGAYNRVKESQDPVRFIQALTDEDVIAALAAAAAHDDSLLANVLATQAQNRVSLYGAILATMAEGVFAVGRDGGVKAMNPAAEQLLGWTLDEARGANVDDLLACTVADKHGIQRELAVCADALAARSARHEEDAFFTKRDGTRFPVAFAAAPIRREDDAMGAVVVFRDISARRVAEEGMRRLAAIVQASEDAIHSRSIDGRITSWNPACEALFGYSAEEALGADATCFFPHIASKRTKPSLRASRMGSACGITKRNASRRMAISWTSP